jgi:lipopolysaccharide transport system permease protein
VNLPSEIWQDDTLKEGVAASIHENESDRLPDSADAARQDDLPETLIERRSGWRLINLRELWQYRELLLILTWRDVKVRYKQTVLGVAWAVLQPLAMMIAFTLFLAQLPGIASPDLPYPLFVFCGLLPWTLFVNAITSAGQSVINNQALVTKVYFPRLIIPAAAAGAGVVDFLIGFGLLCVLMAYFGMMPGAGVLFLPLILLLLVITAIGVGTLLSALTVAYRDFRYVIPFGVQLWMFLTPCIFMQAEQVMSPAVRRWIPLNPAYGLIDNFRRSLLAQELDLYSLAVSGGVGALLLVLGSFYFRKVERNFADII